MPRRLTRLTEARIKSGDVEGKLRGLAGEGKPLPHRPGDVFLDPGDAIGHRSMAEAGALPEEILLARKIKVAREAYAALNDRDEKRKAMARIADLETLHAHAAKARRKSMKS